MGFGRQIRVRSFSVMGTRNEEILTTISILEIVRYASSLRYARSLKGSTSDSSYTKHYQTASDLDQLEVVERCFDPSPKGRQPHPKCCIFVQECYDYMKPMTDKGIQLVKGSEAWRKTMCSIAHMRTTCENLETTLSGGWCRRLGAAVSMRRLQL
jgi:hypothetical protein